MLKKVWLVCLACLGMVSPAFAIAAVPTVTYTLTAVPTSGSGGNFTITMSDSLGDNFGIASFKVVLNGTGAIANVAPQATYLNGASLQQLGFVTLMSADASFTSAEDNVGNPLAGAQDNLSATGVVTYGIGQAPGVLVGAGTPILTTRAAYTNPVVIGLGTYTGTAPTISSAEGGVFLSNTSKDTTASGVSIVNVVSTPEPASLAVLALGGIGLLARRRAA